mgnify:CR=1 FL=1
MSGAPSARHGVAEFLSERMTMALDVKVPPVGESVQEAMIHKWLKASGDVVKMDDVLMERLRGLGYIQ